MERNQSFIIKVHKDYRDRFPDRKVLLQPTIYRIWQKQNSEFTVHNLGSKASGRPKAAIIPENRLDRDSERLNDNANINSCWREELGLLPANMARIIKHHLHYG